MGEGAPPGTVPLQNPEVTSRKACLRNAEPQKYEDKRATTNVQHRFALFFLLPFSSLLFSFS